MSTFPEAIAVDAADPVALGGWWASLLGWRTEVDADGDVDVRPPAGEPGIPLLFLRVPDPGNGSARVHLDVRSRSAAEQRDLVARAGSNGARRLDLGQGDVPWVVMADPEGTPFCILEPRQEYATSGSVAALVAQALDPVASARFWAAATGWGVTASEPGFAAVRAPGGSGPGVEFVAVPRLPAGKNRVHVDLRPRPGDEQDAEVRRLTGLGASPRDVGQGEQTWVVLADPEGTAFCVLAAPDAGG